MWYQLAPFTVLQCGDCDAARPRDQRDCMQYHLWTIYFDFTEYHLWMSYFRCGTFVNGRIILHSWDLSDYHLWTTGLSRFLMLNEHYDAQWAQPILRLYSSRFVVESCDVFVGNRTLFEVFWNISTVREPNESYPQWIAFRNFVKTGIQFAVCTKTIPWFFVTFEQHLNWMPNDTRWLKPEREKQSVFWSVACCLEFDTFVEKPLGSFDRDRFCFGFQGAT